jgi:hypothetical protein
MGSLKVLAEMVDMYGRRLFIWESKHQKNPNDRIVLKGFFMIIHFLNHAIEKRFAVFILNKRFHGHVCFSNLFIFTIPYVPYYISYLTC